MLAAVHVLINSTPSVTDHLKENRDFYNNTPKPGYSALTYPHPLVGKPPKPNLPPVLLVNTPSRVPSAVPAPFSTVGSYDPEGVSLTYFWSFGDGAVSSEQNPSHAYPPGTFKIRLDASDGVNTTSTNLTLVSE